MNLNNVTVINMLDIASEYFNINAIKDKLIKEAKSLYPNKNIMFGYQKSKDKEKPDSVFTYYES